MAAAGVGAAVLALALWVSGVLSGTPQRRDRLDPLKTPPQRYAWTAQPDPAFPIPPYARYLENVRIVVDPGHGGRAERANWKVGPTGLREEEVNLRVAQFLREFLVAVGADVKLTRDRDVYLDAEDKVDLALRAALANEFGADLFLSIHHNGSDEPGPNYTTLFYHDVNDASAASRCAARYLLTGLSDALRLEEQLPCAVLGDTVLYKNGLAVLRQTHGPAVLSEASFHSNPAEEARLRGPVYNRREAYGLFLGLARWAQAGLPRVRVLRPTSGPTPPSDTLVVELDDGLRARGGWGNETLRIAPESVVVKLNGQPARFALDLAKCQAHVEVPSGLSAGTAELYVDFENVFGQHVLHPDLAVALAPREVRHESTPPVKKEPARRPAGKKNRPVTRP